MTDQDTAHRSRRGAGRDAKRAARLAQVAETVPFITRKIPYYEVLGEEGLALIEHNADTVLEEIGIDFKDDPEALQIWRDAGADIQGERVRFPAASAARWCRRPRRVSTRSTRAIRSAASSWSAARHGLRAELRLALRARSRSGPTLRHDRGFP